MWGAQFISNVGSWVQTVGAQWLMLALTGSPTLAPPAPRLAGQ